MQKPFRELSLADQLSVKVAAIERNYLFGLITLSERCFDTIEAATQILRKENKRQAEKLGCDAM